MVECVDATPAAVEGHHRPGNDLDDAGHTRHDLAAVLEAANYIEAEHEPLLTYERQEIGLDLVHAGTRVVDETHHV